MAGWSMLSNGDCAATTDTKFENRACFETGTTLLNPGAVVGDASNDFQHVHTKGKDFLFLRYQNRSFFMNEVANRNGDKSIPPKLGDGRCVDLFKFFWVVREKGGYEFVTKNGLWGLVTDAIGLSGGVGISSGVKLIYIKYLGELDHWIDNHLRKLQNHCGLGPSRSFQELVNEVPEWSNSEEAENGYVNHKHVKNGVIWLDASVDKKGVDSRKRKHDSLSEMLHWVIELAKCPYYSLAVTESKGFLAEARWAREVLLLRKYDDSKFDQAPLQKKLRMHPCMYEDPKGSLVDQFGKRLRCSERLPSLSNNHVSQQQCDPCPATSTKIANTAEEEDPVVTTDILDINSTTDSTEVTAVRISIPVGPNYQAVVPEWSGAVSNSDPKWLGTRVWPADNRKGKTHIEGLDSIGKGREENLCECTFPRSVECVRFHLSENRMALQLELGSAFYHWRFDGMGEEVSLRWTPREEKRFKKMVMQNRASQNKCFWDKAGKHFPKMKRENLVAYYFNVYVVQRRSYQNRVTPKDHIDSDDDETGFGCFSESYGDEAVKVVLGSKRVLKCTQNGEDQIRKY